MKWPTLLFDNVSLILFAIGAGAVILPHMLRLFPPLKTLKAGPIEAEFERELRQFERKVIASEAEPPKSRATTVDSTGTVSWEGYFEEYFKIVNSPTSNVEKILGASILLERMLLNVAKAFDLPNVKERTGPATIVRKLLDAGLIGPEEQAAFNDFWALRNKIVHGAVGSPTDEQTARMLDLVWRLVRTLA
jgi:hypothetical protein